MSLTLVEPPQKYLFLAAKTRRIKHNELFVFQIVEIQWFTKREMNCDYLLIYVIVSNFANQKRNCFSGLSSFQNIQSYGNTYCWHFSSIVRIIYLVFKTFQELQRVGEVGENEGVLWWKKWDNSSCGILYHSPHRSWYYRHHCIFHGHLCFLNNSHSVPITITILHQL